MIRYIILFIIILLLIVFTTDYICIFKHFENLNYTPLSYENFQNESRECRLYKNNECDPEYSNHSKLQLISAYIQNNKKNNSDKNNIIKNIFNNQKPCYYTLDKLTEIHQKTSTEQQYILKVLDDTYNLDNNGNAITRNKCIFNPQVLNPTSYKDNNTDNPSLITTEKNELIFRNFNYDKLKANICKNKSLFLEDIQNLNEQIFYKIKLHIKNYDFDNNKFDISCFNISIVEYNNNTNNFEIINNQNDYIEDLISLSYDTKSIYFVPKRHNVNFYIFSKNICNDYILKKKSDKIHFDLSMVGFDNTTEQIINHNISLNQNNHLYNLLSTTYDLNSSKDIINNEINNLNNNLILNKNNKYIHCKNRKERLANKFLIDKIRKNGNVNALQKNINIIEDELLDINKFLVELKDIINSDITFLDKINNGDIPRNLENKIINHCNYKFNNKQDLDIIYKDFNTCKNNLQNIKKNIMFEHGITNIDELKDDYESNQIKSRLIELKKQIKKITDFKNFVNSTTIYSKKLLDFDGLYPNNIIHNLNEHSNKITDFCNTSNNKKDKTILEMQNYLINLGNDIDNAKLKENTGSNSDILYFFIKKIQKNNIRNFDLLQYVSDDDCLYFTL
jgi:hypothetical protein